MDYNELGQIVTQLRKERDWTQQQLAEYTGISRQTLSAFENGKASELGLRKFLFLLEVLGYKLKLTEKSRFPTLEELQDEQ